MIRRVIKRPCRSSEYTVNHSFRDDYGGSRLVNIRSVLESCPGFIEPVDDMLHPPTHVLYLISPANPWQLRNWKSGRTGTLAPFRFHGHVCLIRPPVPLKHEFPLTLRCGLRVTYADVRAQKIIRDVHVVEPRRGAFFLLLTGHGAVCGAVLSSPYLMVWCRE